MVVSKAPRVSIVCLTYNHAAYIELCLAGFASQRTDFPFEVIVNDDHSTDNTLEIVDRFRKRHGLACRIVRHRENRYSQGLRGFVGRFLLPMCRGEYIALCEGDDFWVDDQKLTKQVALMDASPAATVCFHRAATLVDGEDSFRDVQPTATPDLSLASLVVQNLIPTSSVLYRKVDYSSMRFDVMPADWYLALHHLRFGGPVFIPDVMSVYRRNPGGIWWDSGQHPERIWARHGEMLLRFDADLMDRYRDADERLANALNFRFVYDVNAAISADRTTGSDNLSILHREFPHLLARYLRWRAEAEQGDVEL